MKQYHRVSVHALGLLALCVHAVASSAPGGLPAHLFLGDTLVECVFRGGQFTEGPAVAPDGSVYFSDLTFVTDTPPYRGHIWRYDPVSGTCTVFRSPSNMSNGLEFDTAGRLLATEGDETGARRIVRTDMTTGMSEIVTASYGGKAYNSPNDLVLDVKGGIYFTDPRYGNTGNVEQPVRGVYRIDADGAVTLLIPDISMPNGLAIAPDGRTLYVGCNDEGDDTTLPPRAKWMAVFAYDLTPSGSVVRGRKIIDFDDTGGPDGMSVDGNGDLYIAVRDEQHPGIGVYDPRGHAKGYIGLPEVPSNVVFDHTSHHHRLYVTAGGSLYRITLPVADPR